MIGYRTARPIRPVTSSLLFLLCSRRKSVSLSPSVSRSSAALSPALALASFSFRCVIDRDIAEKLEYNVAQPPSYSQQLARRSRGTLGRKKRTRPSLADRVGFAPLIDRRRYRCEPISSQINPPAAFLCLRFPRVYRENFRPIEIPPPRGGERESSSAGKQVRWREPVYRFLGRSIGSVGASR